jgi:hypothetical protein
VRRGCCPPRRLTRATRGEWRQSLRVLVSIGRVTFRRFLSRREAGSGGARDASRRPLTPYAEASTVSFVGNPRRPSSPFSGNHLERLPRSSRPVPGPRPSRRRGQAPRPSCSSDRSFFPSHPNRPQMAAFSPTDFVLPGCPQDGETRSDLPTSSWLDDGLLDVALQAFRPAPADDDAAPEPPESVKKVAGRVAGPNHDRSGAGRKPA